MALHMSTGQRASTASGVHTTSIPSLHPATLCHHTTKRVVGSSPLPAAVPLAQALASGRRCAQPASGRSRAALTVCASGGSGPWAPKDSRLVLEDGSVWEGSAFGVRGTEVGEVVFNTSITGYQEIMTDPSYKGQFVNFTHPHIGNTGINEGEAVLLPLLLLLPVLPLSPNP